MKKGILGFVTICSLILLFKMVCGFSLVAQYDVLNLSEVCNPLFVAIDTITAVF